MKPHKWTEEQKAFMTAFVPGHSRKEITEEVNRRFDGSLGLNQITAYIKNNKLNTGRTGRFEKWNVPINKGTKGMFPTAGGETKFKPGNKPHNHLEVGSEVINGDGYWQVKVLEPNVWKFKHRLIWEQVNGSIPDDHVLIFADQDRNNFDVDNLLLIRKQQFIRMNKSGLIKHNKEATKTGVIIADLIIKTAHRSKQLRRRNQNEEE